jgi:hypothetical protein
LIRGARTGTVLPLTVGPEREDWLTPSRFGAHGQWLVLAASFIDIVAAQGGSINADGR